MRDLYALYYSQGLEKGKEEGYTGSFLEDFAEGYAKGVFEEILQFSCSLYDQDFPIDEIAEIVDLTVPETEKIIDENLWQMEIDNMCDLSSLYYSQGVLNTKTEVVRRLYEKKFPIDEIAEIVDLTIPETEKLIKENLSIQGG